MYVEFVGGCRDRLTGRRTREAEMAKTTYHRRKAAGLCPMCGGPREEKAFVQCGRCRRRDRKRDDEEVWDNNAPFNPTAAQIAEAAAEIQEGWTPAEERKRRGVRDVPYVFPVVRLG
jgi:hypothetical protein